MITYYKFNYMYIFLYLFILHLPYDGLCQSDQYKECEKNIAKGENDVLKCIRNSDELPQDKIRQAYVAENDTEILDLLGPKMTCNYMKVRYECLTKVIHEMKDCFTECELDQYKNQVEGLMAIQRFFCIDEQKMLKELSKAALKWCQQEHKETLENCNEEYQYIHSPFSLHNNIKNNQTNQTLTTFEPPSVFAGLFEPEMWSRSDCIRRLKWSTCYVDVYKKCDYKVGEFYRDYSASILHSYATCKNLIGDDFPSLPEFMDTGNTLTDLPLYLFVGELIVIIAVYIL